MLREWLHCLDMSQHCNELIIRVECKVELSDHIDWNNESILVPHKLKTRLLLFHEIRFAFTVEVAPYSIVVVLQRVWDYDRQLLI